MNITQVRYTTEENDQVEITFDDLTTYTQPYNEARYRYTDALNEWLAVPNTISPYDPWYGKSDQEIVGQRWAENADYTKFVISLAEANPRAGINLDSRQTSKENSRRVNRAKGKNKISDADDELADYTDSCMDALDNADDEVENLSRQALIDWDASTWTYPVWIAP